LLLNFKENTGTSRGMMSTDHWTTGTSEETTVTDAGSTGITESNRLFAILANVIGAISE
jgi:hypothetical protein